MATLQSLNDLATAVNTAAEAFNAAVDAARAEAINVDVRVNYAAPSGATPMGVASPQGIVVTASLPLPLPTV